jgi:hypothetical protein
MGDVITPDFGRPLPPVPRSVIIPTLEQALLFLANVHTTANDDDSLTVHLGQVPDEGLRHYYAVAWSSVRQHLGLPTGEKCFLDMQVQAVPAIALKSDVVTCENGHRICEVARDLLQGEAATDQTFCSWEENQELQLLPWGDALCAICKAPWLGTDQTPMGNRIQRIHFATGWR